MADTWITDMTHFLDPEGNVPDQLRSRQLIRHLGAIVAAVTSEPTGSPLGLDIKCWRRPGRKLCLGKIHAGFEPGTSNITWHYPICGDRGLIQHWQTTSWDNGARALFWPKLHVIAGTSSLIRNQGIPVATRQGWHPMDARSSRRPNRNPSWR